MFVSLDFLNPLGKNPASDTEIIVNFNYRTLELGGFDLEPFDEIMANHAREHGVFGGTLEI